MLLVDSNIIIDVITNDPVWSEWSIQALEDHQADDLSINPAIYAELSHGYRSADETDKIVRLFGLKYVETPRDGLFRAAKAFGAYKKRGGGKNFVLPDFFIGGHAESSLCAIITRDVSRYQTYFSSVPLIHP